MRAGTMAANPFELMMDPERVVQVRPRERGFEAAGAGHEAVAQARILQRVLPHHGIRMDAHERIAGADMAGQRLPRDESLHCLAQVDDLLRIDRADLRQRAVGVGMAGGRDEGRQIRHEAIVQCPTRPWLQPA